MKLFTSVMLTALLALIFLQNNAIIYWIIGMLKRLSQIRFW